MPVAHLVCRSCTASRRPAAPCSVPKDWFATGGLPPPYRASGTLSSSAGLPGCLVLDVIVAPPQESFGIGRTPPCAPFPGTGMVAPVETTSLSGIVYGQPLHPGTRYRTEPLIPEAIPTPAATGNRKRLTPGDPTVTISLSLPRRSMLRPDPPD